MFGPAHRLSAPPAHLIAVRGLVRLPLFVATLAVGVLGALLLGVRFRHSPRLLRARIAWLHRMSPRLLRALGVERDSLTEVPPRDAGMTVANHISYVDVLLIAAARPSVFVTSTDVRDTPGLGFLCRMAGCAFVDRKSAQGLRGEIAALASVVRSGFHVVVFPEATSSRGDSVLPFKAALFEAARLSGRPLRAAVVDYDAESRAHVSYAGDDRFVPHLLELLGRKGTSASVRWIASEVTPAARPARELAAWAHAIISAAHRECGTNDNGSSPLVETTRPELSCPALTPRPTTN